MRAAGDAGCGFAFRSRAERHNSLVQSGYRLVHLRNGTCSIRSLADDETFHPGIGPAAEAEALYVRQLHLPERVRETAGEFVIWDVGLGAAANALTTLRLIREELDGTSAQLRLLSFDQTTAAAAFALEHARELGFLAGFESVLEELIRNHAVRWDAGSLRVEWALMLGDFPSSLGSAREDQPAPGSFGPASARPARRELPPPHAILFDPHSPKKNPAMWTKQLFCDLFSLLDSQRPCALATFTRSTMVRTALLLAGFYVGAGRPSGLKEETTVAANLLELLDEPLGHKWLERARRSGSAEPLDNPVYCQAPLNPATWGKLRQHPQFAGR